MKIIVFIFLVVFLSFLLVAGNNSLEFYKTEDIKKFPKLYKKFISDIPSDLFDFTGEVTKKIGS